MSSLDVQPFPFFISDNSNININNVILTCEIASKVQCLNKCLVPVASLCSAAACSASPALCRRLADV